jgi:ribose 5-phosphate isomerase B
MFYELTMLIASDHAGRDLKTDLLKYFNSVDQEYNDLGVSSGHSVDYPDFAHALCQRLSRMATRHRGVLICGTGIGMSIVANRYPDIRCAIAVNPEMAQFARLHNDANVLALGARIIDTATAIATVEAFIDTDYEGGRHDARLVKINSGFCAQDSRIAITGHPEG